jgi:hypothetical protein
MRASSRREIPSSAASILRRRATIANKRQRRRRASHAPDDRARGEYASRPRGTGRGSLTSDRTHGSGKGCLESAARRRNRVCRLRVSATTTRARGRLPVSDRRRTSERDSLPCRSEHRWRRGHRHCQLRRHRRRRHDHPATPHRERGERRLLAIHRDDERSLATVSHSAFRAERRRPAFPARVRAVVQTW